ncbi:MAG: hypothetical protein WCO57_15040 [Verrucomicrobiota bacterium]
MDFQFACNLKQSKSIYQDTGWKDNLAPLAVRLRAGRAPRTREFHIVCLAQFLMATLQIRQRQSGKSFKRARLHSHEFPQADDSAKPQSPTGPRQEQTSKESQRFSICSSLASSSLQVLRLLPDYGEAQKASRPENGPPDC